MREDKKNHSEENDNQQKDNKEKEKKGYLSPFKKAWEQTKKTVSGVSESVIEAVPKNLDEAKEKINTSVDFVVDKGKGVLEDSADLIKIYPRNVKLKFKDDIELIKSECSLLNEWKENKVPPAVMQSAVCATLAMGLGIKETELARLSRDVMDRDGRAFQEILEYLFGPQQIKEINIWMDTVPGTDYAGGGIVHRVQHGHDIEALIELINDQNLEGALTWFNHVALRDFWTPAGVPYLPSGSGSVYEWLCELGLSSESAADLLTINSWEVMAAILAYNSSKKMYGFIRDTIGDKRAKRSWERGLELEELGDYEAADHCFQDVLSYVSERHHVEIWYATNFLSRAQKQEKENLWYENLTRCYDLASRARLKLSSDSTIPYQGGILTNLRGLATTLMVSSWSARGGNVNAIKGVINSGVDDFLKTANYLKDRWFERPFSAIANEALALNLLMASPFNLGSTYTPLYVRNRIVNTLGQIASKDDEAGTYSRELLESFKRKYPLASPNV